MMGLGSTELLIILIIVLVLFGGSRIPQIFSGLGRGIRDFRKGLSGAEPDEELPKPKDDSRPS